MEALLAALTRDQDPAPVCNVTVPLLYYTLARYVVARARRARPAAPDAGDSRHDFVVVGGGTAGCALARRLAEQPRWTVLLLEAGGEEPEVAAVPAFHPALLGSELDWSHRAATEAPAREQVWPAGRLLGGTSAIGRMLYLRGNSRDYDDWRNAGNVGWGYGDVLDLFKKSESVSDYLAQVSGFHGTDGPLPVQKFPYEDANVKTLEAAFTAAGLQYVDVNGETQEGMMRVHGTQRNGRRTSVCRAFLQKDRPNLTVKLRSRVTKVLFNTEARQAIGVEYISGVNIGRPVRAYANKEVILTAGVVGSAQLLMLSGVGPNETLSKFGIPLLQDLKVGQSVYDAPEIPLIKLNLTRPAAQVPDQLQGYFLDLIKYVKGTGPLTTPGPSQLVAFVRSSLAKATDDVPDIMLSLSTELAAKDAVTVSTDDPNCPAGNNSAAHIPCYYDRLVVSPVVLRPRSKAEVSLQSADPLAPPAIRASYLGHARDVAAAVEGARFALRLAGSRELAAAGLAPLPLHVGRCRDWPRDSEPWWRCAVRAVAQGGRWGAVGGCRMGPASDRGAVVDPRLRVRGVKGLRVADASVVPSPVGAGALATVVMIAEKCALLVRDEWCEEDVC
ncbi:glucose dehydrogenase [FAD, quinone]-like [Bacillus rossius redtenbacheri]|uniref:glucose dehydrogenase [FAD, quinone]-like n=1 Tax=Bacillus rossius redtenbacheri TaxID=93214 RepID=UPI002FDD6CDA